MHGGLGLGLVSRSPSDGELSPGELGGGASELLLEDVDGVES